MFFHWSYLLLIPGFLFGLYAQMKVRNAYGKLNKVMSERGITGAQAARAILESQDVSIYSNMSDAANGGKFGVAVEQIGGKMTDHFDPVNKVIRLSDGVYNGTSVAAVGIAAHEAGHVIQHATGYMPMKMRAGIYPLVAIGSNLWFFIFLGGLFLSLPMLVNIGIFLFTGIVVFQLITLPVEFNASSRAMALLTERGIITENERPLVKEVLNAAALTYVAALVVSILQLAQLLLLSRDRR